MDILPLVNASGVYCIFNLIDGKRYIGSSLDVRNRIRRHLSELRREVHHSRHLQRSFVLAGESAFVFRVIEYCDGSSRIDREQYWMDRVQSYDPSFGYNLYPDARHIVAESRRLGSLDARRSLLVRAKTKRDEARASNVRYRFGIGDLYNNQPKNSRARREFVYGFRDALGEQYYDLVRKWAWVASRWPQSLRDAGKSWAYYQYGTPGGFDTNIS